MRFKRFLVAVFVMGALSGYINQVVYSACTFTSPFNLCKQARHDPLWDTQLNNNFDLIASSVAGITIDNTLSGNNTFSGTATFNGTVNATSIHWPDGTVQVSSPSIAGVALLNSTQTFTGSNTFGNVNSTQTFSGPLSLGGSVGTSGQAFLSGGNASAGSWGTVFKTRGAGVGGSGSTITAGVTTASYTASSGTPYAADVSTTCTVLVTVDANLTMNGPTNGVDGQKVTFRLKNDASHSVTFATGSGNFAFGSTVTSYTVSTSSVDYVGAIYYSSGSRWHIVSESLGFAP